MRRPVLRTPALHLRATHGSSPWRFLLVLHRKVAIHGHLLSLTYSLSLVDVAFRERELASIKVRKEDVDLIVRELEVAEGKADRALREHNNDVVATLRALMK